MTTITFTNVVAAVASIAGILAASFNIPKWLNIACLSILLFVSLIPLVFSLISFVKLKTSRWICFKLDMYSYILGSSFEGWLAQRMVEGRGICCNNNLKEPQTILFDEYFTFAGFKQLETRVPLSLNYTLNTIRFSCYHQPFCQPETDGFAIVGGTFSELDVDDMNLDEVMQLVKFERVCIYFNTGEITQRITYDGGRGECVVVNFIYTHSKAHIVGLFEIYDLSRIKQLFYMKGMESIHPKLKVAEFVKIRRGVIVMHYQGDMAFYKRLCVEDIVRVKLDKCELLSFEGA